MGVSLPTAISNAPDDAGLSAGLSLGPETLPTIGEEPQTEGEALDLVGILSAVEETAYTWDLVTDRLDWESNALAVLGVGSLSEISTGSSFQFLIAAEHLTRRHDAISGSAAEGCSRGVAYRVQFRFVPAGRRSDRSIWLEDHGRWWPGTDGKPQRARGVIRVINDRYWEEQRLLHRSDHDELTGQLNRIRLTEALGAVITRSERTGQPCALLMAAVNNLAVINETFGFDIGDEVIGATARAMKEKLRGGDTLGRYSSNKFGIILNDCGPGAMRIAAERFMKAVRNTSIRTTACQLTATISIGGVILPDQAATVHQALSHSLQALDRAKHRRLDCFMAYEPSPTRETARRRNITIADDVISALDDGRMLLVLQPMVSAKTGKPAIYECLLRMARLDGTLVSAGEFIPVAEQLGLSRLVDKRTLELAIGLLKKHPDLKLSVNVSSLTASDHDWVVTLHRMSGGRREITSRLIVEITETAAIHDIDQTVAFVDTLKELGCEVAIDDFGAGYTSFKNLKILNVDMVKIDGAFVKNLKDDSSDQVFIKTLIELARTFDMETVAEWVGDQHSADYLAEVGITYLQGFHYGMPLTVDEFEARA
ncbi:MAG: putative bifunctional diguanylate cyclase/phosphodiesterase [Hyphomicrobium sp.]